MLNCQVVGVCRIFELISFSTADVPTGSNNLCRRSECSESGSRNPPTPPSLLFPPLQTSCSDIVVFIERSVLWISMNLKRHNQSSYICPLNPFQATDRFCKARKNPLQVILFDSQNIVWCRKMWAHVKMTGKQGFFQPHNSPRFRRIATMPLVPALIHGTSHIYCPFPIRPFHGDFGGIH